MKGEKGALWAVTEAQRERWGERGVEEMNEM